MRDDESTSGYQPPNYTQIPNIFFDAQMAQMGEPELRVVLCAMRKMFGFHKSYDAISLSQFEKMTGLSRPAVVKGIEAAVTRGVMQQVGTGKRGIAIYELCVSDEQPVNGVYRSDDSEDATGKQRLPELVNDVNTQKKIYKRKKDKDSVLTAQAVTVVPAQADGISKEKDIHDTPEPKLRRRSEAQLEVDRRVESLGKAYGVHATNNDYSLYAKTAQILLNNGIPESEFEQYIRRIRRIASQQKWTVSIPALIAKGRVSEYIAARDEYNQKAGLARAREAEAPRINARDLMPPEDE